MNFLDDLQKQPVDVRKKIMLLGTIVCGLIIFILWLFVFPHSSPSKNEQKENQKMKEEFAKLKDDLSQQTSKFKMSNFNFKSLESILKNNLTEKNDSNDGKRLNKIPRLPLE